MVESVSGMPLYWLIGDEVVGRSNGGSEQPAIQGLILRQSSNEQMPDVLQRFSEQVQ